MITVEKRENTQTNYLRLWCATCARELARFNYGLEPVKDDDMSIMDHKATKHETRNHGHNIFIFEGSRLPTLSEIRNGN